MTTIDEINIKIAHFLSDQITQDWKFAQIDAEFFNTAANFDITYTDNDDCQHDLDGGYTLLKLIRALHEITTQSGSNPWNRILFRLYPDGKFNIDFSWDQALADEIERLANS